MSHLTKAILWLSLALLMAFCCVIDAMGQHWFAFVVCAIAFVFDIVDASIEFSAWARELGKKEAQKQENKNDT